MFVNSFGFWRNVKCGLLANNPSKQDQLIGIQLKNVEIHAVLIHNVAQVQVKQTYKNIEASAVEMFYYFPLKQSDTITAFELTKQDGTKLNQIVLPLSDEKLQPEFAGDAHKLGVDDPNYVYQAKLGILPAGSYVKTSITYVTEGCFTSEGMELIIPNTTVPNFSTNTKKMKEHRQNNADLDEEELLVCLDNDEDLVVLDNEDFSKDSDGKCSIKVEVFVQGCSSICSLESSSHTSTRLISRTNTNECSTGVLHFKGDLKELDKDFVIFLGINESSTPRLYRENGQHETILMSTFSPKLMGSASEENPFSIEVACVLHAEPNATDTESLLMKTFVNLIPSTFPVNFIGLTDQSNFILEEFQIMDSGIRQIVANSIQNAKFHQDIIRLLESSFSINSKKNFFRQVILLVTKELMVQNPELLISSIRKYSDDIQARLFIVGIGTNAMQVSIMQQMAKAGSGIAVCLCPRSSKEHWETQIKHIFKLASVPSLKAIAFAYDDWIPRHIGEDVRHEADSEIQVVEELPGTSDKLPALEIPRNQHAMFQDIQSVNFHIFSGRLIPKKIVLSSYSSYEYLSRCYKFYLDEPPVHSVSAKDVILKSAFASALKELEETHRNIPPWYNSRKILIERKSLRNLIREISLNHDLPSSLTEMAIGNRETTMITEGAWARIASVQPIPIVDLDKEAENKVWINQYHFGSIPRKELNALRNTSSHSMAMPSIKIPRLFNKNIESSTKNTSEDVIDLN